MKITKRQLRRIIREERQRIILEFQSHDDKLLQAYEKFINQGMRPTDSPFYVEPPITVDGAIVGGGQWLVIGDDMLVYGASDNEAEARDYAEELNTYFQTHARRFAGM
jgi:hypothetical protein